MREGRERKAMGEKKEEERKERRMRKEAKASRKNALNLESEFVG
jgi:hypothetical protein